jgi:hypothetical protein
MPAPGSKAADSASLTALLPPVTMRRCGLRFWAIFPTLRHSPQAPEFEKLPGCAESMAAAAGEKRKGIARVRLADGSIQIVELHWYEAAGIGRKEFKIKHLL